MKVSIIILLVISLLFSGLIALAFSASEEIKYSKADFVEVASGRVVIETDCYGEELNIQIGNYKSQLNKLGDAKYLYRPPNNTPVGVMFLPKDKEFKLGYIKNFFGLTKYFLICGDSND